MAPVSQSGCAVGGAGVRVANGGEAVLPEALAEEGGNVAAEGGLGASPR